MADIITIYVELSVVSPVLTENRDAKQPAPCRLETHIPNPKLLNKSFDPATDSKCI